MAEARVQASGGAVYVSKGTLVLDGVAISDMSVLVRDPSGSGTARRPVLWAVRVPWAVRRRASAVGSTKAGQCHVQYEGGAVSLVGGAVTLRGGSTITNTRAVRFP